MKNQRPDDKPTAPGKALYGPTSLWPGLTYALWPTIPQPAYTLWPA